MSFPYALQQKSITQQPLSASELLLDEEPAVYPQANMKAHVAPCSKDGNLYWLLVKFHVSSARVLVSQLALGDFSCDLRHHFFGGVHQRHLALTLPRLSMPSKCEVLKQVFVKIKGTKPPQMLQAMSCRPTQTTVLLQPACAGFHASHL